MSGKIATVTEPTDDAWLLIRFMNSPVRRSSWNANDRRCTCRKSSLRNSSTIFISSLVLTYWFTTATPWIARAMNSPRDAAKKMRTARSAGISSSRNPGSFFSPRTLSTMSANGHGSARATSAPMSISAIDAATSGLYGFR